MLGHLFQPDKTAIAATSEEDRQTIKDIQLDGLNPTMKSHDILTGDIVTTARRKLCARANDKMHKACEMAQRLIGTVVSRRAK